MEHPLPSRSPQLGSRILKAGAGAGKTTTLVRTFIDFVKDFRLRNDGEYPKIVVTTFTRKATQEVKERLLKKALTDGEDAIFRYIGQRSRVQISTIHGVLGLFLGRFGERVGLPPDFRIAEEREMDWISRRELRRLLTSDEKYLALLENEDFNDLWMALEEWTEAKSFKEATDYAPAEFFREKTLELLGRFYEEAQYFSSVLPDSSKNQTWISWGEMLSDFRKVPKTDEEIQQFLKWVMEIDENFGTKPRVAAGKAKLVDEAVAVRHREFMEEIWNPLTDPEKNRKYSPEFWSAHEQRCALFSDLGHQFLEKIEKARREKGLLSMGDLERLSLQLVRTDPAAAESFAAEWDYWMIDEYQDTSPVQVELLKALVRSRPHFVVGDPQQSIYFFRGARSQVFHDKMEELDRANLLVEEVVANRRSRAPLLEFFNDFFAEKPAFAAMEAKSEKAALPMSVPAAEFRWLDREEDDVCVAAVIERIQELLESGAKPETICVLSRKNAVLKEIQIKSRTLGVPVHLHTAGGFGRRREILDAVAFLRFLLNPADNLNFLLLLRSPWFHLKDEEIIHFCKKAGASFWAESLKASVGREADHPVLRLKAWMEMAAGSGLAETLRQFYHRDGILDSAQLADPSGRREANLWKLLSQLESSQRQPGFNGLSFLKNMDQSLKTEEGNQDGDAVPAIEPKRVQMMTVHASKGLEFDHVIITHLQGLRAPEVTRHFLFDEESGWWTLAERDLTGRRVGSLLVDQILKRRNELLAEESVRLLYVAMTRAMQTVTLISEKPRTKDGRSDSRSWSALVPFSLEEGEHQREKYLYRVRTARPEPKSQWKEGAEDAVLFPKWSKPLPESLRFVSPTQLIERANPEQKDSVAPFVPNAEFATKGLRVAQRGTEAHRLFESLKYTSPEKMMKMAEDAEFRSALDWIRTTKELPLMDIIKNGEVEWGFAARGDGFLLQGQIDLWGVVDDILWLVDYKTGSMAHAEKAIDQMVIYAWALQKLNFLRADQEVRMVAVYPLEKKTKARGVARASDLQKDWERLFSESPRE